MLQSIGMLCRDAGKNTTVVIEAGIAPVALEYTDRDFDAEVTQTACVFHTITIAIHRACNR